MKKCTGIGLFLMGVGSAVMIQQIKNGNMKKFISNMNKKKIQAIDELEDMM